MLSASSGLVMSDMAWLNLRLGFKLVVGLAFTETIYLPQGAIRQTLDENRSKKRKCQKDINITKQCLELCIIASEASRRKIYRIYRVTADGESDQAVINMVGGPWHIKLATPNGNSADLVGSMTEFLQPFNRQLL